MKQTEQDLKQSLLIQESEAYLNIQPKHFKSILIAQSILSGILFGFFNFAFGAISDLGYASTYLYSTGAILVCSVLYLEKIYRMVRQKYQLHYLRSPPQNNREQMSQSVLDPAIFPNSEQNSIYISIIKEKPSQHHKCKLTLQRLFGLLLRTFFIFLALFFTLQTYKYALLAQINQGISSALFSISPIITSLTFYYVFKENLHFRHIIGIFLMVLCVVLISLSKGKSVTILQDQQQQDEYLYLTILCGFLAAIFISFMSLISRVWYTKFGYDAIQLSLDSMMLFGVMLLPFFIIYHVTVGYTTIQLFYGVSGSAFSCFANIILADAIVKGLGGPAGALAQTQSGIHTILSAIFLNQQVTLIQILGLICAIFGTVSITAGHVIYAKFSSFNKK